MVVQHDEIKKLLKGNNLDSTNEWIVYGTKGERGYWIALSDRGVTLLPVAQQGNLTGEIIPFDNQKIKRKPNSRKNICNPRQRWHCTGRCLRAGNRS